MIENKKAKLIDTLRLLGIIPDKFTGKITINCNDGSICAVEVTNKVKLT